MLHCTNMNREILLFFTLIICVSAWDDDDLEVFDVVEEVNENFYELLGVPQTATPLEVKSAFKKLTLKLHPDKNKSPNADIQFRNLVSVHNILKDPGKREKYNEVLKTGLPNWRSAVYYYRHVRKMGLAEGALIIFVIVTFGQYAVAWAAYFEKKYTVEQIITSKGRKQKKTGFDTGLAEILDQLPRPSLVDTLPCQIPKLLWWSVTAVPRGVMEFRRMMKEKKEEERRQQKREEEERLREEREEAAAEAAREARAAGGGAARRRRGFVPAERAARDAGAEAAPAGGHAAPVVAAPSAAPAVSGGLWTDDDLAELVRLVKRYPGGAPDRWERIADAMGRGVPEVTHMAAKLKENCYKVPAPEPEPAAVEPPKKVKTRKTEETSGGNWSQPQQKALEAALAKHPKGGAGDRWQKIAANVPDKSKEECMQRCKYLSEMVKKQRQKEEEDQLLDGEAEAAHADEVAS